MVPMAPGNGLVPNCTKPLSKLMFHGFHLRKAKIVIQNYIFEEFFMLGENELMINNAGLILGLRPANERRCYFVTTSLIGWAQT